jgi:hypothetical protein
VQESSSRLKIGENSGRIKPSKLPKESQEVCVVDAEKVLQVCVAGSGVSWENHLVKSCRSPCEGKRLTVRIICGEFMKSHELSDLMEEQGSYGEYSQRFMLRKGRTVDSSQQGSLDLQVDFYFGVS